MFIILTHNIRYFVLSSKKVAQMTKLDAPLFSKKSKGGVFVVCNKNTIYFSYIITEISKVLMFILVLSIPPYFSTVFDTLFNPRP